MSDIDDTDRTVFSQSDGVPDTIIDDGPTQTYYRSTQPAENSQIIEAHDRIKVIDISDGVPLVAPEEMADTQPSLPHTDPSRPSKPSLPN